MKLDLFINENLLWKLKNKDKETINNLNKIINKIPYLNIQDIASQIKVTTSYLSRFIKKIGFENFKIFKYWCLVNSGNLSSNFLKDIYKSLILTEKELEKFDFISLAKKIIKSKSVVFIGGGASYSIAKIYATYLLKINIKSIYIDGDKQYQLNYLNKDSLLIAISNTGNSTVLSRIAKIVEKIEKSSSILITTSYISNYKKNFEHHLYGAFIQNFQVNFKEIPIMGGYIIKYILDKLFLNIYNVNMEKNNNYLKRLEQS